MNRKNIIRNEIKITVITAIMVIMCFVKVVSAEFLHGCPQNEIVMRHPGVCPDGSNSSLLKEAYIPDDADKVIIDTLSAAEKLRLGIAKDNKFVIVTYVSPATEEASFVPGKDKSGNTLRRKVVDLKYKCRNDSIIASSPLFLDCQLFDPGTSAEDQMVAEEKNVLNLKAKNAEREIRESMRRSIDESWPIFYSQLKETGLSEKEMKDLWEEQKKLVYEQYNYDPETDSFKN